MKFTCTTTETVVQTKAGKIKGFKLDDIYAFHGIKYAESKRFEMPTEVEPWEGVKDALSYGYTCPHLSHYLFTGEVKVPHRYWAEDEDCLYLNVWTKAINDDTKKPVMVWLHGGGFTAGSSIEHVAYDGNNMSKYGDVVTVSINHRLNILGYFNMEPYGEKYKNSGNAGTADMVASLQWVHDNIEQFGGDPDNVTIFGQSGGGMKVWTLMQTPAADGLFHKGIIQSGVAEDFMSLASDSSAVVNAMLSELGLDSSQAQQLAELPYKKVAKAYLSVAKNMREQGEYFGNGPMANDYYLGNPRVVGFREHAKNIPVMVGSAYAEFNTELGVDKTVTTKEQLDKVFIERYGDKAEELKQLYKKAYPERDLADLLALDHTFRKPSKDFIAKKSNFRESATYSYVFAYEFPYENGQQAWHCSEIPFAFHNIDMVPVSNEEGVTDKLQDGVFGAWTNFAKTGNPNNDALPNWPECTPGMEHTMVFAKNSMIHTNHDKELMDLYVQVIIPFIHRFDPIEK